MTFTANAPSECGSAGKVSMSYQCGAPNDDDYAQMRSLDRVSSNLASPRSSESFQTTLRWVIYKIVEANKGITLVQLKKLLRAEYGIDRSVIDPALAALTSSTLLNGIKKWRNPRMKDAGEDVGYHLFVHAEQRPAFAMWCDFAANKHPELLGFVAPVLTNSRGKAANA